MKILILGGFGFVGNRVRMALQDSDHQTICFSRRNGLDLTDFDQTLKILKEIKPEAIINCAAHVGSVHYVTTYAAEVIHDNIQMALNLYKAVKEVCPKTRIINPLSNCSYPGEANIHFEPDWWKGEVHHSVYSYGNSKRMIYVLSHCYQKEYQIKSLNFLVPNTYGPGDSTDPNKVHAINGMIIRLIQAQRNREKEFEIWGSGKPIREWGYIDDVIYFLIKGLTIEEDLTYPVNIAQNRGYSIKESAEIIAEVVGYTGKLVFNTHFQDGAEFKILENTKFKKLFPGYTFFDFKKGIQETVNYYTHILGRQNL